MLSFKISSRESHDDAVLEMQSMINSGWVAVSGIVKHKETGSYYQQFATKELLDKPDELAVLFPVAAPVATGRQYPQTTIGLKHA